MSERLAVLLRGINVGGVKIPMADLKDLFVELGFADVQTVLATGNVVGVPPDGTDRPGLKALLESALSARFAYEAHVLVRDAKALGTVLEAARSLNAPADVHTMILFCDDPGLPAELNAVYENLPHRPGEDYVPVGGEALWLVPKGATVGSEFGGKVLGGKRYKARLTSRNLNTVEKVLSLLTNGP